MSSPILTPASLPSSLDGSDPRRSIGRPLCRDASRQSGRPIDLRGSLPSRDDGREAGVKIGELMMILDLHRQGLSVAAIARETGKDAKTIRRYIAHGLEPPVYGPRPP